MEKEPNPDYIPEYIIIDDLDEDVSPEAVEKFFNLVCGLKNE